MTTATETTTETPEPLLEGACGTCNLRIHLLPRERWLKPDLPTYSHTWAPSRDADHIATCTPLDTDHDTPEGE